MKMYYFMFFIIFCEFNFAVEVYGNSTLTDVEDYLVPVYDMEKYMEYNIPQTRTTEDETTQATSTWHRSTVVRVTRTRPMQASTTSTTHTSNLGEDHVNETSPGPPKTTSGTGPTEPSFKPLDYLVTITPEQIDDIYSDFRLWHKTIVEQTISMYGEDNPNKYKLVSFLLWSYFKSIAERYLKSTRHATKFASSTPPTEDYLQDITEVYQNITTEIQVKSNVTTEIPIQSTTINFHKPKTNSGEKIFKVDSTLKPVTRKTKSPPTTVVNQNQTSPQSELTKPPGRQRPKLNKSTYRQHQPLNRTNTVRRLTNPSIKLPQNKSNPSTPGKPSKYKKMSPDHNKTQWIQTKRIGVNVKRQGTETSVDPEYYDVDATTVGHHVYTEPGLDSLIYGITTPPPPSTYHPVVKDVKIKMVTKNQGYFMAFVQELCTIIAIKNPRQSKGLYVALDQAMANIMHRQGLLVDLGIRFEITVTSMIQKLLALEPDVIQSYASITVNAIDEKEEAFAADVQSLFHNLDDIYSYQEGEELLNTLVQVYEYPKNGSAFDVAENVVKKVFKPYFRLAGSQTRQFLIQSINSVLEKRSFGHRRRTGESYHKKFGKFYAKEKNVNSGFQEKNISNDNKNCKITTSITKLNDMKMNEVIVKELIENVKIMEAIEKYKTKIVQATANSGPNIYKRDNFDKIKPKRNENSNDSNRERANINLNNKKDKISNLDDEVIKYKLNTKQNPKIKKNKESRKILFSEMGGETDRLSGSTSKSESVSKTHQNKLDKYMKHKIKNHLIRNHVKLHKNLYKSHRRNEETQMNIKNKVLRKNDGQNRFKEVKKPHEEPSFKDKIRASDNERPSYNMRHSNEENRRRLPGNRRHYSSKRRPPGANRRPSDSITRNPDANQQPSMYLTPRYEYNSRRFKENLNLTRRSNAKPISTELSYSNEENDIKFNLQDAIRHPIDLKSKIKHNSLIFDKVQNGRRQMAPVDRLGLRDESNYSDDEGTIKNNIYKVFNKNS